MLMAAGRLPAAACWDLAAGPASVVGEAGRSHPPVDNPCEPVVRVCFGGHGTVGMLRPPETGCCATQQCTGLRWRAPAAPASCWQHGACTALSISWASMVGGLVCCKACSHAPNCGTGAAKHSGWVPLHTRRARPLVRPCPACTHDPVCGLTCGLTAPPLARSAGWGARGGACGGAKQLVP